MVVQEGKNVRSGTLTAPSNRLSVQLPNHMWTFDFNFGQAIDYRALRYSNITDELGRQVLRLRLHVQSRQGAFWASFTGSPPSMVAPVTCGWITDRQ